MFGTVGGLSAGKGQNLVHSRLTYCTMSNSTPCSCNLFIFHSLLVLGTQIKICIMSIYFQKGDTKDNFFYIFEQVWFRCGINHHNPEGSYWEEVSVPGEVVQISSGPGDLVWAVLWEGHLLVREGISRDCLRGERSGAVHSLLPSYHFFLPK